MAARAASDSTRAADLTERSLHLRGIPVTAELPPRVLNQIAQGLEECEFARGDWLQREGEAVDASHLLTSGGLALHKQGNVVGALAPPQSIGFLDIIARSSAGFGAQASSTTTTLRLRSDRFLEFMEDHFELLSATLRYAAQRLLAELKELPAEALGLPAEPMPIVIPARGLDLVERVFVMRRTAVFRTTNVNVLALLAAAMPEHRVPAGTVLFEVGAAAPYSHFVIDGTVSCEAADGRSFRYGPSTAVGGVESLAGQPRWYRAVADTDLVLLRGSTDALVDMMEDNFDLGFDFISMLAGGLKGLLARKAALGAGPTALSQKRDVSGLGKVPVGA